MELISLSINTECGELSACWLYRELPIATREVERREVTVPGQVLETLLRVRQWKRISFRYAIKLTEIDTESPLVCFLSHHNIL